METERRIWPDIAIPPGEFLAETLATMGISQAELARRSGRPVQVINEIVLGKKEITAETALQFERVLGTPAHVWVGLEADYHFNRARLADEKRLVSETPLARRYPCSELAKRGLVRKGNDWGERVGELLRFFGVASLQQISLPVVAWRKSRAVAPCRYALAAWLRQGELLARQVKTDPFNASALRGLLPALRGLTGEPALAERPQELLRKCGVALVFVPEFPKTGAHGATRWIGKLPIMQLSIRYGWADIFWFTLFHEIGHLLKHGRREEFIEFRDNRRNDVQEIEADGFARDWLIPPSQYARFVSGVTRFPSRIEVLAFAAEIGIAPGVVVGRLQHDKILPPTHLNGLRSKLVWAKGE